MYKSQYWDDFSSRESIPESHVFNTRGVYAMCMEYPQNKSKYCFLLYSDGTGNRNGRPTIGLNATNPKSFHQEGDFDAMRDCNTYYYATKEEVAWMEACIAKGKFVPCAKNPSVEQYSIF